MLKISSNVTGLDVLQKRISMLEKMKILDKDKKFNHFIQEKVMQTLNEVMNERLGGTTNDEYIEEYKLRNKIIEEDNGFILYNDFTIPAILSTKSSKNLGYHNYEAGFSIALAFEYGVGIVGQENPKKGAWDYNINEYEKGWYYKTSSGEVVWTRGYEGLEIYRFTKQKVEENLTSWYKEYIEREAL